MGGRRASGPGALLCILVYSVSRRIVETDGIDMGHRSTLGGIGRSVCLGLLTSVSLCFQYTITTPAAAIRIVIMIHVIRLALLLVEDAARSGARNAGVPGQPWYIERWQG